LATETSSPTEASPPTEAAPPTDASPPTEASETTATATSAKKASAKKAPSNQKLLPGAKPPKKSKNKNSGKSKEKKPAKKVYSLKEKLTMINQYQKAVKGGKADLAKKWGVDTTSVTQWIKAKATMERQVEEEGRGGKKTVLRKPDPLGKIKDGVVKFYEVNKHRTKHFKIPITGEFSLHTVGFVTSFGLTRIHMNAVYLYAGRVLSVKAGQLKDELLRMHADNKIELTDEEVKGLEKFKASESWATQLARDRGWKSKALHGEAGCVDHEAAAPQIQRIQSIIHGNAHGREYRLENVYNMDETGLLFKCLPNRSYVSEDEVKTARGTKLMKAKNRVTLYVCTNADGSDFVPLSIIGAAENPRCFSNHEKKLTYYNQRKAWSDTKTIKKWFADFLIHVKRRTNEPVLLIMDNCAAHNEDTFKDVSGQVRVVFLPPNCTSVYQPMDCGVIAMIKKKYRHRLLLKLLEVYNDMMTLYEQNKGRSKGTNGLDEGYPPHIRDCMDILAEITPEFTPEKIRNCWRKSTLLNKPPVAVDPVLAAVDPAPATASHTVAAATTASEGDVEMGVVDAADRVDTINESDDESGDEDILKAMTDLAELVKGQKGGDKGAPSGGSWEMSYILEELVETVEGIDVSDADARKELLNGWVSMEDTQFCKEAFADEAENDVSPEELLEGDGTYHDSDDDEAVKEAETELAAAKKMILMRLPRSFEIWRRGWRSW